MFLLLIRYSQDELKMRLTDQENSKKIVREQLLKKSGTPRDDLF